MKTTMKLYNKINNNNKSKISHAKKEKPNEFFNNYFTYSTKYYIYFILNI